ncbi:MAG: HEAT repeat domain-containing protein, partial [Planctomycetes bacterium]|nr:HEAT repeat domain-containing protein [Planctomycetota bacterium]
SRLRAAFALITLSLLIVLTVPSCRDAASGEEPAPRPVFPFAQGDSICMVGGALAERMQHDGWLETLLQCRDPQLELSFRNLGFGADEVGVQQRTKGFGSMDDYLERCGATVVFAFFGYNESFKGEAGLPGFERELDALVTHLQSRSFGGAQAPRIVLFSTSAHEHLGHFDLPDVDESDRRLEAYNAVTRRVAEQKGVTFVDLFEPMQRALAPSDSDLTINGIHLTTRGNLALAQCIVQALTGEESGDVDEPVVQRTRQAVVAKNEIWFQRYRATDGYNVYGGRSSLKYEDEVSNWDVLQREMEHLDALAVRHTRRIHALAHDRDAPLDLEGVPPLLTVRSNFPGENPDGSHRFKSGEGAIADMTVGQGLSLQLFASEEQFPELVNPVQMSWDARGRLWVAVWPTYPHSRPDEAVNDKLLILEDVDGDGRADSCKVFASALHNPTGFEFWQGGVFVANAPDLLFLEDRDGDDVADHQERILHGLSSADTHHAANSFVVGPDGALYFQEGTFHQTQIESRYGPVRNHDGCVWRFEPRTWRVERHVAYNFANPHGHVFDRWGQEFVTDGTGNQNYYALPFSGRVDHPKKHRSYAPFFPQRCRPSAATEILSSQTFGPEFEGDYLIANVIGFRGILRYQIHDAESGFGATEVEPIVFSEDANFRPSDLEVGPDGALYFLDWHNPIIGHMQHHLRDPNRDRAHGRVYRVSGPVPPVDEPVRIEGRSVEDLVALLRHPENRVRYRVRAALSARDRDEVLTAATAAFAAEAGADEHFRLELLWLHQQFNAVEPLLLERVLQSKDPRARAAATRVIRGARHQLAKPLSALRAMANDPDPRVRLEAVVAASFFDSAEAAGVALDATQYPSDRFLDYALEQTLATLEPRWRQAIKRGDLVATHEAGQARLLQSIEARDLSGLPSVPAVWRAMLTQTGVADAERLMAAESLAEVQGRSTVQELIKALETVDATGSEHLPHLLDDLSRCLQSRLSGSGTSVASALRDLEARASKEMTRQVAVAGRIALTGSLTEAWSEARQSTASLRAFMASIPLVSDPALRQEAWAWLRPLVFDATAVPVTSDEDRLRGLQVAYYQAPPPDAKPETFAALTTDATGLTANVTLDTSVIRNRGAFGLQFRGLLRIEKAGTYRFFLSSDDGSRLFLDGELVVDNDGAHASREKDGVRELAEGWHPLVLNYFDAGGDESLTWSWSGPGFDRQRVPDSVLMTDPGSALGALALAAVTSMPGHAEEKFRDAARLIGAGRLVTEAVALAESVPRAEWPAPHIAPLIDAVAGYAGALSAARRTEPETLAALNLGRRLASGLAGREADEALALLDGLSGTVVLVRTLPHRMLFDRREIWVEAGKPVAIVFQNNDVMPHNFVVTQAGAMQLVGEAAERLSPTDVSGRGEFVPDRPEVLWHTALLKPGESARLSFVAPAQAGDLPYVCTFPGHWRVMNGL